MTGQDKKAKESQVTADRSGPSVSLVGRNCNLQTVSVFGEQASHTSWAAEAELGPAALSWASVLQSLSPGHF